MSQVDQNHNSHTEEDSDVLDLFGILRRRKGFIILGLILGVIAAGLYQYLSTPIYRAEMEILIGQKSADMVNGANSNTSVEGVDTDEDVLSTHIQLMTSPRILKSAIKKHNLKEVASIKDVIAEGGTALGYIAEQIHVTKGGTGVAKDAHTLRASFDDPSKEDCALILRAVFDEYDAYLTEHFASTSTQAIELLKQLSEDTSAEVKAAENALIDHLAESKIMWDGEKSRNIHKDRLDSIEKDLLDLTESEAQISSRLAVITDFVENSNPEDVTDFDRLALLSEKEVSRIKILFDVMRGDAISEAFQEQQPIRQETARAEYDNYLELVMKEKKLLENFNDDHPSVMSVREQIELMRKFIDDNAAKLRDGSASEKMKPTEMLDTYVGLLKNDLAGLERERKVLIRRSSEELKLAKAMEKEEMKANALRLELVRRQDLYKSTNDTLSELNFVRDYAGFSTDVIGDADPQQKPAWPKAKIVLPLGAIAGLVLGLIMGLVADMCDTTFADPEDVERALGAPLIAHVHRFPPLKRKRKDPPFAVDKSIYAHHRPRSPEAEVFRVIRTSLLMSIKKSGKNVIQITSPLPGDGKSTTSANLAVAFAQTGKRVLLIDADLRKPRVAKLLRLECVQGLADALLEEASSDEVIEETAINNLWAVGTGIPGNPAELLESDMFQKLLDQWRTEFDYVIVDSPPVLAVSDAIIIGEKCDVTLMTMRVLKNGRRIAMRAAALLRQQDIQLAGLVVNNHEKSSKNFGYMENYDADSYGYGYGNYSEGYYRDADTTDVSAKKAEPVSANS